MTLSDVRQSLPEAAELEAAGIALELGGHTAATFAAADLIVLSPGVPRNQPVIEAARSGGAEVIGELELASRWLAGRIVAITGTKGKSTTTTLTGRMLEAGGHKVLVGGNIGHALSAQVEASTAETIHVVEASSFQLEGIETFHPWIAVLLNFSPDHLDRHATVDEYAAAKARIFENQSAADWAVLNADDPASLAIARDAHARRLMLSMTEQLGRRHRARRAARSSGASEGGSEPLVPLTSIRLLGRHLLVDVMAASAVAHIAGVQPAAMTAAVEGFTGLEHALEPVTHIAGVQFVNDSKATNIEAARRAIESFGEGLVVILGGRFKGGDFADLAGPLAARRATVIAIGEVARPHRRGAREGRRGAPGRRHGAVRCARRSPRPRRGARCCWRRRAPASTCSRTMRSAGGRSSRRRGSSKRNGTGPASSKRRERRGRRVRRVSNER